MKNKTIFKSILAFSLVFLLFFGCINLDIFGHKEKQEKKNEENNAQKQELKLPSFSVIYPSEGEVIETGSSGYVDVEVLLTTSDMVLSPPSDNNVLGSGHFVFILDNGEPEISSDVSHTLSQVGPGEHTLYIEFVNNDGTPYVPKLSKTVHFTVKHTTVKSEPKTVILLISGNSFNSDYLELNVGDAVNIINKGNAPYYLTIGDDSNVFPVLKDKKVSYTFKKPGTYEIKSMNYPNLKTTVIVK